MSQQSNLSIVDVASFQERGEDPPAPGKVRRQKRSIEHSGWSAYLYVIPAFLLVGVFIIYPLVATVYYSFTNWTGLSDPVWVGLANYQRQFNDPRLLAALWHALFLMIFFSVVPIAFGLLTAALMSRTKLPGMDFFRTVLFLPQVIPLVVIGYAWKWLYAPDGAVNQVLRAVGLENWTRLWLGDMTWSLPAVGVIGAWVTAGFCMVLFLSGIARIDQSQYDAARVDGAGPIREFFAVTLPGIRGEMIIALTVTIIGGLRSFDVVFVTTGGGPVYATQVPALRVYQLAFYESSIGQGAAVAVLLTVAVVLVGILLQRIPRNEE